MPVAPMHRVAEDREFTISPEFLLEKLQILDPGIQKEYYVHTLGGRGQIGWSTSWDIEGLVDDLRLTQESYSSDSLEAALEPIREEMKRLVASRPRPSGPVEILPGKLMLGDASAARNLDVLRQFGVRRIVNCSPQTVKTGSRFYQTLLPGAHYMELWEDDLPDFCVLEDLEEVWSFATAGGCCLLHCEQGVNRSGALVVALHMRLRRDRANLSPDEVLRTSWHHVANHKARVLTNPSFQRQLLLYARLGLRWFPSVSDIWRTSREQMMARFRRLAERVGEQVVCSWEEVPVQRRRRAIVYIRDGTMRCEMRMHEAFDLSSADSQRRAEQRIRSYAQRSFAKLSREESPPPEALPAPAAAA